MWMVLFSRRQILLNESLNQAADSVYGNDYSGNDLTDYEEGLDYKPLRQWERYLTAGVSKDWIEEVIDEKEGTVELLHEQFLDQYRDLRENQKLFIKANNLLIPVGKWALSKLEIDKEQEPWILLGSNRRYTEKAGLEIGNNDEQSS